MLVTVWCPVYMVSDFNSGPLPKNEWDYRWYKREADLPVVPHTGDFLNLVDGMPHRIVAVIIYEPDDETDTGVDVVMSENDEQREEGYPDFSPRYYGDGWEMLEKCVWDFPTGLEEVLPKTTEVEWNRRRLHYQAMDYK